MSTVNNQINFSTIQTLKAVPTETQILDWYNKGNWCNWKDSVSSHLAFTFQQMDQSLKAGTLLQDKVTKHIDNTEKTYQGLDRRVKKMEKTTEQIKEITKENSVQNKSLKALKNMCNNSITNTKNNNNKLNNHIDETKIKLEEHLENLEETKSLIKEYSDEAKKSGSSITISLNSTLNSLDIRLTNQLSSLRKDFDMQGILFEENKKFCDSKFQDFETNKNHVLLLNEKQSVFLERIDNQSKIVDNLNDFYRKITPTLETIQIELKRIFEEGKKESQRVLEDVNHSKKVVQEIEIRLSSMLELAGSIQDLKDSVENLRAEHSTKIDTLNETITELSINFETERNNLSSSINSFKEEVMSTYSKTEHLNEVASQVGELKKEINELKTKNENQERIIEKLLFQQEEYARFTNYFRTFFNPPSFKPTNEIGISLLNTEFLKSDMIFLIDENIDLEQVV